jgi:sialic acid synthase SpsE
MVDTVNSGGYESIDTAPYYGDKQRELEGANNEFRPYFNKSLMAGMDISDGTTITREMIYAMRPKMYSKGLPSQEFPRVLGKKVAHALKKFDPITDDVLV